MLVPFFLLSFRFFWFSPGQGESVLFRFFKGFSSSLPSQVKMIAGAGHMFFCLLLVLLSLNIGGIFPYSYPVMSHFIASFRYAFPF